MNRLLSLNGRAFINRGNGFYVITELMLVLNVGVQADMAWLYVCVTDCLLFLSPDSFDLIFALSAVKVRAKIGIVCHPAKSTCAQHHTA